MRDSDRYINPRVVALLIVCGTALLLAVVAALTWLTARGFDPDPVLKLTAQVGGGVAGVLSLLLQLANRATIAKTERATGRELPALRAELEANTDDTRQLAGALQQVAEVLPRPVPRHTYPDTALINGAAPASRGS